MGTPFSQANVYGMTIRESATDGSDFTSPDADYRRFFLGEDGNLHLKDSSGSVIDVLTQSLPAGVPGLAFWLDANAITGLSDGNEIVAWPSSVTSIPSFDAVASGNPTYQTNERNSKPIVRLDGTDYFKATIPALTAPGVSIFVVFKLSSLTPAYTGIVGFGRWYASSPFISEAGGYFIKSNGKSAVYPGAGTSYDGTGSSTFDATNWNYVSLIFGPTTYDTRRNGSADRSGTTWNYGLLPDLAYIGNQAVTSRVMTGDIAEVLIYGRSVTSTERDAIESYLVAKWGF